MRGAVALYYQHHLMLITRCRNSIKQSLMSNGRPPHVTKLLYKRLVLAAIPSLQIQSDLQYAYYNFQVSIYVVLTIKNVSWQAVVLPSQMNKVVF